MHSHRDELTRRELFELAIGLSGVTLLDSANAAVAQTGPSGFTPFLPQGPFYPQVKPVDDDADLTTVAGSAMRAQGKLVHVTGRVLNLKGEPVSGARIEVWQANAHGRYSHPSDMNPAPADPSFQGYGVIATNHDGFYSFKTIKPGPYPGIYAGLRAPHIHFDVSGKVNRLITQMFFPNEPENARDAILQNVRGGRQDAVIARIAAPTKELEPDSIVAVWDVVLMTG